MYFSLLQYNTRVITLYIGKDEDLAIMPVHLKFQIYTFTFSDNPLLTQQNDS